MQGRSSAQLSSNILSAPSTSQRSACAERRPGFPPARAPLAPLLDPRPSQQLRLPGSPRGSRVSLSLAPHLGSRGAVVTRSLHRTLTTPAVSPAKLATDAYALASPNSPSVQEDVLLASASLVVCMSSLGLLNTTLGDGTWGPRPGSQGDSPTRGLAVHPPTDAGRSRAPPGAQLRYAVTKPAHREPCDSSTTFCVQLNGSIAFTLGSGR